MPENYFFMQFQTKKGLYLYIIIMTLLSLCNLEKKMINNYNNFNIYKMWYLQYNIVQLPVL